MEDTNDTNNELASTSITQILMHKMSLLYHRTASNFIESRSWWNQITDNLYLGGIPLEDHHLNKLTDLGISAVLSIVEDFEFENTGIFGYSRPIDPQRWQQVGVEDKQIQCVDHTPLSIDMFEEGTQFIDSKIQEDSSCKIYLHCKVGVGRSVSMAIAYLMKYLGMSFDEAHQHIQDRRQQINLSESQIKALKHYYEYLHISL